LVLPTSISLGPFALTDGGGADDADMNADLQNAKIGRTARPSFNHPNIVLFCFADGHALPLSPNLAMGI
jgi:hypothetical protein